MDHEALIFVHIPKTAGTTLNRIIDRAPSRRREPAWRRTDSPNLTGRYFLIIFGTAALAKSVNAPTALFAPESMRRSSPISSARFLP